jgi:hypothetical protein
VSKGVIYGAATAAMINKLSRQRLNSASLLRRRLIASRDGRRRTVGMPSELVERDRAEVVSLLISDFSNLLSTT